MPESSASKRQNGSGSRTSGKFSARDAGSRVREELPELLGKDVESILAIRATEDGGWEVTVAVVELARIPTSTDVLGAYRVTLDTGGELVGYERRRRYIRSQADED